MSKSTAYCFLLLVFVFDTFSQAGKLKIKLQYDTLNYKAYQQNKDVSLKFAYDFNWDRVVITADKRQVLNDVLVTDSVTDFAKELVYKPLKGTSIPITIKIGNFKSVKIKLCRTNYYYFFYSKEEKSLEIRLTMKPLITG